MNRELSERQNPIIERLKSAGSSSVFADVMGVQQGMDFKMKPVNYKEPLAGQVRTVSAAPGDNLFLHHAIYASTPGDILVVDGKGYTQSACLGELMAGAAQKLGIKGIVVDGLVRDQRELRDMDIQVYAKGFIPVGPSKDGPGSFDETITCGGTVVSSYDYVIGDEDGVVVIPASIIESTLDEAEKKLEYEKARMQKIDAHSPENNDRRAIAPSWLEEKMKQYDL
ncbi:RraA family protein [Salibacterium halotolerans]|nr:RraA family protein [Salibacterium halotolerans]